MNKFTFTCAANILANLKQITGNCQGPGIVVKQNKKKYRYVWSIAIAIMYLINDKRNGLFFFVLFFIFVEDFICAEKNLILNILRHNARGRYSSYHIHSDKFIKPT